MRFSNDAHDWLGGHPYESAAADEMREFLAGLGLPKCAHSRSRVPQACSGQAVANLFSNEAGIRNHGACDFKSSHRTFACWIFVFLSIY
jgi:hypothetical protein